MSVTAVPLRPLARGAVLKLWLGLALLALVAAALAWWGTSAMQRETTDSGLQIQVIEEGEGEPVTPADLVALRYQLRTADGELIQDSESTGQPFVTGTEGLFPGFSEGLQRMREGGRYRLWIPPGLHVQETLPPDAPFSADDTLVFDVEVLQIARGMAAMQQLMGPPGAPPAGGEPPAGALSGEGESAAPPTAPPGNAQ